MKSPWTPHLTIAQPDLADLMDEQAGAAIVDAESQPPPRNKRIKILKKNLGTADSVASFLDLLPEPPTETGTETFFRGQSASAYELKPTLMRKREFMRSEDRLCKELLIAHHDEFQGDQYRFDHLVRMRHHGLPTRLLDTSVDPLVALFFACTYSNESELNSNGEVFIFHVNSDSVKYYDSDTVSCIANLSKLTYKEKKGINRALDKIDLTLDEKELKENGSIEKFNEIDIVKKLVHHIKSEKGFFEERIVPKHLRSIVCVKAKLTNSRIKSQSGAFLLFGEEAVLPKEDQDGIKIDLISVRNKAEILKKLNRINVNAKTVYPSIDQTADHLKKHYQTPDPDKVNSNPAADEDKETWSYE